MKTAIKENINAKVLIKSEANELFGLDLILVLFIRNLMLSCFWVRIPDISQKKNESFLFIAAPIGRKGKSRRLTQRSIEKLIEKYASAFGKPALTVHSLRHSFATRYHLVTTSLYLSRRMIQKYGVQKYYYA
ncbi:tyrosine-type recombinase/integrase [Paenibacillus polymyxa]|uniref:tyrosine-type recombinase/integrase n=1 Tax=Paenibacillus polymyxa TaxID=1406 RepID=UPI003EB8ABA2